jgi:hypothetical protein
MRMTGEEQDRAAGRILGHHPPLLPLTVLITRAYHSDISFSGKPLDVARMLSSDDGVPAPRCATANEERFVVMNQSFRNWVKWPGANGSYTVYSISCAVVWAIILPVVAATGSKDTRNYIFVVFIGWAAGWTSATIARAVMRPAKPSAANEAARRLAA